MKKLIVKQSGFLEVQAERSFVVEVPDDFTTDQIEAWLYKAHEELEMEEVGWTDDSGVCWRGYDVTDIDTEIDEPDPYYGPKVMNGLDVIRFVPPSESKEAETLDAVS